MLWILTGDPLYADWRQMEEEQDKEEGEKDNS